MFRPTPRTKSPFAGSACRAFTLIELLTVIAIIGVLAAILIPTVGRIRESARSTQCSSNLRQISAAFNLYAADNKGLYPAPRKSVGTPGSNPKGSAWQPEISPYVLRDQTLGQVKSTDASVNIAHCPSFDLLFSDIATLAAISYNTAGYGMNMNIKDSAGTVLNANVRQRAAVIANPAKTVLVGDSCDYHLGINISAGWQVIPADPMRPDGYNSGAPLRHGSSANYVFVDGHVASLSPDNARVALNL